MISFSMNCDMCGKEGEMFRAMVEGAEVIVCQKCSKYGRVKERIRPQQAERKEKAPEKKEKNIAIVSEYSRLIKQKRESLGLSQKDFAQKLSEKESLIHKIETGHIEPSMDLARKLEKLLKIKLIEESDNEVPVPKAKSAELTLGDFVKVKKR